MQDAASLPDDVESLKQIVLHQRALLLSRDVLLEKLKIELLRLKRMRFGRSSEQLDAKIAQLELMLEDLETHTTQIAAASSAPIVEEHVERAKPVRRCRPLAHDFLPPIPKARPIVPAKS